MGLEGVDRAANFDCDPRVIGISVYQRRDAALATVQQKVRETAELLGLDGAAFDERIVVKDDYLGGGYGVLGDVEREATKLLAQHEGILIGPVYTGRAVAGLIDLIRRGEFSASDTVLFWHTGGAPALFAYAEELLTG